ncbi:hypothetical protein [Leptothoe spongobia]|uniref:Uncharacterized protein n=1 Tax=Leptothoe spongobia TAU-MAC 1115 TaxID=1967444 RepID=A0A947GHH4_9CYAN|nr:hypothetical protein [Leptothoe spongobia]MBT9314052.1 hypothetical protein [Leptothoe spongobia TAU-MAC 1115]
MSTKVTDNTAKSQLQFIQNHQTALDAGEYQIEIEQTVKIDDALDKFSANLTFVVQGDRFTLAPQDIHAVFPPVGSLGDHSHILPHIALEWSTLPWERLVHAGSSQDIPWLALILIHEGELVGRDGQTGESLIQPGNTKIVTLKELQKPSTNTIKWPGITLEAGQEPDDKVSVIDVPKTLLLEILPTTQDLSYLAHVRKISGETENNAPLAVVISNRLPQKDQSSTAYLVSLESRYKENGEFDHQNATDEDSIRLVVLKSWSFACSDPKQNFQALLTNLDKNTLRLPESDQAEANKYLTKGYVPLPHYLRQGGKTLSWYHSPLAPGENSTSLGLSKLSVRSADQLIAYNPNNGLFDISYAAAWQLGQLLALQDKQFAISLFNWKRSNAQKLAQNNQQALFPHLFTDNNGKSASSNSADNEFPNDIKTWFEQLGLLSGVPFNYLVPDEQMLPSESIRFFWLDWFWVESLLDGAFSIGRVQASDAQEDSKNNPLTSKVKKITGFLMRSDVVSGWPDLQIDGSESSILDERPMKQNEKLKILRQDRLSEDVLVCLFDGAVRTVDISLKPEGLHFGFNNDDADELWRELRKLDGQEMGDWKVQPIPWKDETKQVVNINNLVDAIKNELKTQNEIEESNAFTAAQFALQMIQGAEKVRLSIST